MKRNKQQTRKAKRTRTRGSEGYGKSKYAIKVRSGRQTYSSRSVV